MNKVKYQAKKIIRPVNHFLHMESTGGILLIASTIIAMVWVNSPWAESYFHLWHTSFTIGYGSFLLSEPLHFWVNDGLMSIFFFFVGLEIKREMLAGELSSFKEAAMPIAAALGGMIFPAAIYSIAFLFFDEGKSGWGIPMATDIAFSIGILTLLGKRVPVSLKVFLTALAIVDDLGAVVVIGLFYSEEIKISYLISSLPLFAILIFLNWMNVRQIVLYVLVGLVMWFFFLESGIHPTVCGVLVAFTIPATRKINLRQFIDRTMLGMERLKNSPVPESNIVLVKSQIDSVYTVQEAARKVQSPLQNLETGLHDWVVLFIMPVFALANAAVVFESDFVATLFSPVAIFVAVSLIVGKSVGITFLSWLTVKLKLTSLPPNVTWAQLFGIALLGGIGFTMSLFVAALAFTDATLIAEAKLGILIGSLLSGVFGYFLLKAKLKPVV